MTGTLDVYDDRIFRQYYLEVGRYSLLTAEQEKELLLRYKTCPGCGRSFPKTIKVKNCLKCGVPAPVNVKGSTFVCTQCFARSPVKTAPKFCPQCGVDRDLDARNKLVEANLKFVMKMATSFSKYPEYIRKLASAGNVGLLIAVDKFNLNRKTRFLTYAASWVRKEMLDELHASGLVHVPSQKQKNYRKEAKQGVYVCCHCDKKVVGMPMSLKGLGRCITGHKHSFMEDTSYPMAPGSTVDLDHTVISSTIDVERSAIQENTAKFLREVLHDLDICERDKFIFLQYYDIANPDRKTGMKSLLSLSAIIDLTPERIRQIKEKTAHELKAEFMRRDVRNITDCF